MRLVSGLYGNLNGIEVPVSVNADGFSAHFLSINDCGVAPVRLTACIMLPKATSYAALRSAFRWQIPSTFNIGVAVSRPWAKADPNRPAILWRKRAGEIDVLTTGQLETRSNQLAHALVRLGLQRGDRVGLILPQCPETAIAHVAIYKAGLVAVPLAALFGAEALEYRLGNAGVRCVITNAAGLLKVRPLLPKLPDLSALISINGEDGAAAGFASLIAGEPETFDVAPTSPDDPAMMIYTSGTTGPPKGALHGHRVLLGHLPGVEFCHEYLPKPGDRMWTPADWAWAGGLLNILLPGLYHGVPVVAGRFEKFDPEEAFALMAETGVRNAFVPPTALKMLRNVSEPKKRFNLNLRTIGSGGESLGEATLAWGREALGLTVNEFYGQTECNYVLSSSAALGVSKSGFIGKAVPGHEVGVIREDGSLCDPMEQGQIAVMRPDPVMFLEYWGRPDATRDKFIGNWMTTGDQGLMDPEGYVHFIGRDDDVITSAGYRIGPGEIEDCLIKHKAIALAAAVGKPDPVRTEIVKAFIVLKPGFEPSQELEKDIALFVRERLSAHEYPREITFVPDLPVTTTGKIIRRILRDRA